MIIIGVVVLLIVCVVASAIVYNVVNRKDNGYKVEFHQLYNSEYDLHPLDNGVFFGTYDGKLNVFVDKDECRE